MQILRARSSGPQSHYNKRQSTSVTTIKPPNSKKEEFQELRNSFQGLPPQADQKTVILAGDFSVLEINWISHSIMPQVKQPTLHQDLLDITNDHGLTQMQTEPTRGKNTLDLFFTNNPSLVKNIQPIPGIGDHDMVLIDSHIKPHINKSKPRRIFKLKKSDWDTIRKDTVEFKSKLMTDHESYDADTNWNRLTSHIHTTMNKNIPSSMSHTRQDLPWLTTLLKQAIRKKHKLYSKAKKSNLPQDWNKYKQHKKPTQKSINKSHWTYMYVNSMLQESLDTKKQ